MDIKANTPKDESCNINRQKINNTLKAKTMTHIVLDELLARVGQGINTHEAHDIFGSNCINSYVSMLANKFNLVITRVRELHVRKNGKKIRYTRYSFSTPEQITAAKVLSAYFHNKRSLIT